MLSEFIARKLKTYGDGKNAPFYINRPLTNIEKEMRLEQGPTHPQPPKDFCSVIHMNSAYLELVDRYFVGRGGLTAIGAMRGHNMKYKRKDTTKSGI